MRLLPALPMILACTFWFTACEEDEASQCHITKRDHTLIVRIEGDCQDQSFEGIELSNADLTDVRWGNTTCPDGTNSDDHPDQTCLSHRSPNTTPNPNNNTSNNSDPNNANNTDAPQCVLDGDCGLEGVICEDGACIYDCADVSCPIPEPSCEGDVIVRHEEEGTCDPMTGQCVFESLDMTIDCVSRGFVCLRGVCDDVYFDMVEVPEGPFVRGHDDISFIDDIKPARILMIKGFFMDRKEVTVSEYDKCIEAQVCTLPPITEDPRYNWSARLFHPINGVTWFQAEAYCSWRSKRLPTEAEWEKAARGTDERLYPWGDDAPTCALANFLGMPGNESCDVYSVEVGFYPDGESPYGVFDMAGNVEEWVADWYDENYYASAPDTDPQGPDSGTFRSTRGGNWETSGESLILPSRNYYLPNLESSSIGFRCVRDSPLP